MNRRIKIGLGMFALGLIFYVYLIYSIRQVVIVEEIIPQIANIVSQEMSFIVYVQVAMYVSLYPLLLVGAMIAFDAWRKERKEKKWNER